MIKYDNGDYVYDCLWTEDPHQIVITDGSISQIIGEVNPISYEILKAVDLYIGIYFQGESSDVADNNDYVYIPMVSVPLAITSLYSDQARVLEYTEDWMLVDTELWRVGIGITNNLEVALEVIGSVNATTVDAQALYSPDGYEIYNLDYLKLVNLDDYSLEAEDGTPSNVVYVNADAQVGINIVPTSDIAADLHVSGDVKIEGTISGPSNIALYGQSDLTMDTYLSVDDEFDDGELYLWDTHNGVFRAGYFSGDNTNYTSMGHYSIGIGYDVGVFTDYALAIGRDHFIKLGAIYGTSVGGYNNSLETGSAYSGIFSGQQHTIDGEGSNITGGSTNFITGDYSSILGGADSTIDGSYSVIVGGLNNTISGDYSVGLGSQVDIDHSHVFMFMDSNTGITSTASDQFIAYALNGYGFGVNSPNSSVLVDMDEDGSYDDEYDVNYLPETNYTLRVAGDIIAEDNGTLGYLIGDGTYIRNVASLWFSDDTNNYVYVKDRRIGIGTDAPHSDSQLHVKKVEASYDTLPALIRIEGDAATLDVSVTADESIIASTGADMVFNVSEDGSSILEAMRISNIDTSITIADRLGIGDTPADSAIDLLVDGDVDFNTNLDVAATINASTVNAVAFIGDGYNLTGLQVSAMRKSLPTDVFDNAVLLVSETGYVGVGTATADITAQLHSGTETGAQLRLQDTDQDKGYYSDFESSDRLQFNFVKPNADFSSEGDTVFEFLSTDLTSTDEIFELDSNGNMGLGVAALSVDSLGASLSVSGNVSANAVYVSSGLYTSSGIIAGTDVFVGGEIIVTGDITTTGSFIGDGSMLENIIATSSVDLEYIEPLGENYVIIGTDGTSSGNSTIEVGTMITANASEYVKSADLGSYLTSGNNLSDLDDTSTARTNLGLDSMAQESTDSYLTVKCFQVADSNSCNLKG